MLAYKPCYPIPTSLLTSRTGNVEHSESPRYLLKSDSRHDVTILYICTVLKDTDFVVGW